MTLLSSVHALSLRSSRIRSSGNLLCRCYFCKDAVSSSNNAGLEDWMENLDQLLGDLESKERDAMSSTSNSTASPVATTTSTGWRILDWNKIAEQQQQSSSPTSSGGSRTTNSNRSSPVESILIRNRLVHFKRDDQVRLSGGSQLNGNKARKMLTLNDMSPDDFPSCIVSCGGPQSNAMLAITAIVHFQNQRAKQLQQQQAGLSNDDGEDTNAILAASQQRQPLKRFVYFTKKLPRFLRNQPNGNLFRALSLGMELIELPIPEYRALFGGEWGGNPEPPNFVSPVPGDTVWIPQGGACVMALRGARELASEIWDYWSENRQGRPLSVCLPGGTCSTAFLVNQAIREKQQQQSAFSSTMDIRVVVVPCVGDEAYARRQMLALNAQINGPRIQNLLDDRNMPTILPPAPEGSYYFGQSNRIDTMYFTFGEPDAAILKTFREMEQEHGIVLDLLYGAPSWAILLRHFRTDPIQTDLTTGYFDPKAPLAGREIMYVHSGGVEGISSQLMRYQYKGLVDLKEVQIPGRA